MKNILKISVPAALLILALSHVTPAPRHARAEEPPVLGLDELIKMALEASPEILRSEHDIAAAESEIAQATAAQWAQLDVEAFGGLVDNAEKPVVKITRQIRKKPGAWVASIAKGQDTPEWDVGPFGRLEMVISQPLYTFGKILNRKKAAVQQVGVQQAARDKARGEMILRVKELYYSLILTQQGLESAEDVDSFIDGVRTRVDRLLELGSTNVDESDHYRLEAYAADAESGKAKAKSAARLGYLALKKTVGMAPEENFQLDRKELPKDTRPLGEQQEYLEKAFKWRPEFEQIEKGLEAQRYLVDASAADLYPSLFAVLVGSFAGAPGREHLDEPYIGDDYNTANLGGVLGASWHFDLGITRGRISQTRAEYQRMIQSKALAERDIPLEVAKYYEKAVENRATWESYEKAASAARKWIVVSFANFDMGVGTVKDILFAIERYSIDQGNFLDSLYNYHLALANLSHAIGEYRANNAEK
jgi:outer membrane protein TolC